MRVQFSDAGKEKSGIEDSGDCTVIALALTAGISYKEAHEIASQAGRKPNRGFFCDDLLKAAKKLKGIKYKKTRHKTITVGKFIKKNPTGRFFVATNSHAFAVIDGIILDTGAISPLRRLTEIYKVESNRVNTIRSIFGSFHAF